MSKIDKHLCVELKDGTKQVLSLYDSEADIANGNLFKLKEIDGTQIYCALGPTDNTKATNLKVYRNNIAFAGLIDASSKKVVVLKMYQSGEDIYNGHKPIYSNESLDKIYGDDFYDMEEIPDELDLTQLTSIYGLFQWGNNLKKVPKIYAPNAIDAMSLFEDCYSLVEIPEFDTSKLQTMYGAFRYCKSLPAVFPWTIDLAGASAYVAENPDKNINLAIGYMFEGSSCKEAYFKNASSFIQSKFVIYNRGFTPHFI